MSTDSKNIEEIDNYLAGELSPEHIAEFEHRVREEQDVQEDLTTTKRVIEGVRGFALKKMLKGFQDETSDKKNEE